MARLGIVSLAHVALMVAIAVMSVMPPKPLPATAPANTFSEERAWRALRRFAGPRHVGSEGWSQTIATLEEEFQKLEAINQELGRPYSVTWLRTSHAPGQFKLHGLRESWQQHQNMTTLTIAISPWDKHRASRKALLVNAHFDAAYHSNGAADCGSCVAVALESARALLYSNQRLESPVVFLLNGDEELLLLGADAFRKSHAWSPSIGAFVNLESTGTKGLPLVFQFRDKAILDAWFESVPRPMGSAFAEEMYRAKLVPGLTDFQVLSPRLRGLDIALALGGEAYHTRNDDLLRLQPGSMQAEGDNLLASLGPLSDLASLKGDSEPEETRAVFADILGGLVAFRYSERMAWWLHASPFLAYISSMALFWRQRRTLEAALSAIQAALFFTLAVATAGAFGFARAHFLGNPMVFYASSAKALALYGPAALSPIVALAPWCTSRRAIRGAGIFLASLAFAGSMANALSAYLAALPSIALVLSEVLPERRKPASLSALLALPAGLLSYTAWLTMRFFVEKLGMIKSVALTEAAHDAACGAIVGLGLGVGALLAVPVVAAEMEGKGRGVSRSKRAGISLGLLLVSALTCLAISSWGSAYGSDRPKRVMMLRQFNATARAEGREGGRNSALLLAGVDGCQLRTFFTPEEYLPRQVELERSRRWAIEAMAPKSDLTEDVEAFDRMQDAAKRPELSWWVDGSGNATVRVEHGEPMGLTVIAEGGLGGWSLGSDVEKGAMVRRGYRRAQVAVANLHSGGFDRPSLLEFSAWKEAGSQALVMDVFALPYQPERELLDLVSSFPIDSDVTVLDSFSWRLSF